MVVDGFPTKLEKRLPPSTIKTLCRKCGIGFKRILGVNYEGMYCFRCYRKDVSLGQYDVSVTTGELPF